VARPPLRSHPPAWYPDPQDPRRVRRWDGRAWTGDVRPLPDWLRTVHLSIGPGSARHRLPLGTRRLWLVTAALLSLGAAVMVLLANGRATDPDHLGDRSFAKAANRRCTEAGDEVAALRSSANGIDVATRVVRADGVSSAWASAVDDLRDLPVAGTDRTKVERWFETWDRWTTLGHDYADAIDDEDDAGARAIVDAAEGERAALARFALVNAMEACAP
jgi:hypothetical protein